MSDPNSDEEYNDFQNLDFGVSNLPEPDFTEFNNQIRKSQARKSRLSPENCDQLTFSGQTPISN